MKTRIMPLWAMILLITLPACTGYKNLVQEWENFKPSEFYQSQVRSRLTKEIPPAPPDTDFEAQVARIKEMKIRWEKALKESGGRDTFYTPNPTLLNTFQGASTDSVYTERSLADGFSLEALEVLALLRNPGVKMAEKNLRAALESYNQVWNLDEILRQYTAFTEALMTGIGPMESMESIGVKFPFPGVLALKGEVVNQEVNSVNETLEIARRMVITSARKLYWDLLYIYRAQEIIREMLSLLKRLEAVAIARYETGKTNFQDVIKVRIEREMLEEELKTMKEEQRNGEAKILEILNLPPTAKVGMPASRMLDREVPNLNSLYPISIERKQEIRRLRNMLVKMERMIEMAETAIYPAFSLNLSLFEDEAIFQIGTWREKEPFSSTTPSSVGAGLPKMPWYGKNDAYLRETRVKLEAIRQEIKEAENATIFSVRESWFRLDRAKREEALYGGQVVNLSKAALEVSTRGYETGMVSFADVIDSYSNWLKANLSLARKQSDLGMARAELEEAIGAPWKR